MGTTNFEANPKLVNPIDFQAISKMAKDYDFDKLLSDLSWFVHNSKVAHPRKADLHKAASQLLEFVKNDISIIKSCIGCFNNICNKENGIIENCGKKHPLVWAKTGDNNYWPAKQLDVKEDSTVVVWYFGDQEVDTGVERTLQTVR